MGFDATTPSALAPVSQALRLSPWELTVHPLAPRPPRTLWNLPKRACHRETTSNPPDSSPPWPFSFTRRGEEEKRRKHALIQQNSPVQTGVMEIFEVDHDGLVREEHGPRVGRVVERQV